MIANDLGRIERLKFLKPKQLLALRSAGIIDVWQLLSYFPRKYIDRKTISKISELHGKNEDVNLIVKVFKINLIRKAKRRILRVVFFDETGYITCSWFNSVGYIKNVLSKDSEYLISGKLSFFRGFQMNHPLLDHLENLSTVSQVGQIVSLYPQTAILNKANLTSSALRKIIYQTIDFLDEEIKDIIPMDILKQTKILSLKKTIEQLHFPKDNRSRILAQKSYKFREIFLFQMIIFSKRNRYNWLSYKSAIINRDSKRFRQVYDNLPFVLTSDQESAIQDICQDLASEKPMNRLIQGDVGSGKTIVAFLATIQVIDSGYQACVMAPTSILAEQHYLEFSKFSQQLGIKIAILTGSMKKSIKDDIYRRLENADIDLIVGTHTLIQKSIKFKNLGLVVVDEQHRFGVLQRATLLQKSDRTPNFLVMTATPIPRTLTLSVYGDLEVSFIKEMPKGRKAIKTAIRFDKDLQGVYEFIDKQIEEGRQIYIIYPLIEDSKSSNLTAAKTAFLELSQIFINRRCGLLHGNLKSEEKEEIMQLFKSRSYDIMIATTVIEVGVNIPNANVILVMHSERYGLAQLHQLRGRVGRGIHQSYCILHTSSEEENKALDRLNILVNSSDGFIISEEDFKFRGPGEFFGKNQSGFSEFKLLNLLYDQKIIYYSLQLVKTCFRDKDFFVKHNILQKYINDNFKEKAEFLDYS